MIVDRLYHKKLKAYICSIHYDVFTKTGEVFLNHDSCVDMQSCIDLFLAIDPEVKLIETKLWNKMNTCYRRSGDEWISFMPVATTS